MVSAATLGRHLAGERAPCPQVAMPLYGLVVGSVAPCGLAIGGRCPHGLAMASRPCRGLGRRSYIPIFQIQMERMKEVKRLPL
ncbi:hypothetical protein BHM03_00004627 [Ensete ventricosum]|nr:hypothetical protein BHM03_00004627 [Ensete ventricosum]